MAMSALEIINGTRAQDIQKALKDAHEAEQIAKAVLQPKSAFIDPTNPENYTGSRGKPTRIPFTLLRNMAMIPPFWAIVQTRLNQVAQYGRRPTNERRTGFRIALKDVDRKMTPEEKKMAVQYEEFLLKTGGVPNKKRKDNFSTFLRKGIFDSLTLDAWTFEKVPTRRGDKLAEIWAADAASIEFIIDRDDAPSNHQDWGIVYEPQTRRGMPDKGEIEYVQVIDGQVEAEYTTEELAYLIRNPKTDVRWSPFGCSELEVLIEVVTAVLNSIRYNSSYFTESHLPQGVLEVVGKYQQKDMEQFSRYWRVMTTGAAGKWKVPIMAMEDGQGLKFTNFKQSNRDMEFVAFLEFLLELGCAVYQIDGAEVGFSSSKQRAVIQSDSTKSKIEASQDKGLVPLMEFIADSINHEVIDVLNVQNGTEFALTWVGLNEEDETTKWERVTQRLSAGYSTVAMERAKNDDEVPEGPDWDWMHKPLNQVAAAYITGAQQAEAQQQQTQMQGEQQQNLAQLQHQHTMEQAEQKHQHSMAQGTFNTLAQGAQKAQLQDQAHDQKLQQQTFQGLQQGALQGQKATQAQQQAELQHGHKMEQTTLQAAHGLAQQKAGHQQQMEQAEQSHGHQMLQNVMGAQMQAGQKQQDHKNAMEQNDQKHGHSMAQSTFQGLQQGAQAQQQHQNNLEAAEQQADQAVHQAILQATMQGAASRQQHQQSMEQNDQRHGHSMEQAAANPKKPLKKSLTEETIEIEIVLV